MQRKFIKAVGCIITAAMAITLIVVFCFQTFVAYQNAEKDLDSLLNNTENLLLENNKTIEQLKESTADEYLIRARAFAVMIEEDPGILESASRLKDDMTLLDVDELNVTDDKEVIR